MTTRTSRYAIATLALIATTAAATTTAGARDRYANDRTDQDRAYGAIQAERDRQRAAVEAGRNDGSITWYEKYLIGREQARIEQLEREALADGRLGKDEYFRIRQAQDDAARHITAERRDEQVRGFWWRLWR